MIKYTLLLIALFCMSAASSTLKDDCLGNFSNEVNEASAEYEDDIEHCSNASYARHICKEEAALSYNQNVDAAVEHYVDCEK